MHNIREINSHLANQLFSFYRGNYPNQPPYTKGISCSLCAEEETCIKNLCRKQKGKKNHNILFGDQFP